MSTRGRPAGASGTATTTPATIAARADWFGIRNKGAVAILISWDGGATWPTSVDAGQAFDIHALVSSPQVKTSSGSSTYEAAWRQAS